jgi:hypothetical protein
VFFFGAEQLNNESALARKSSTEHPAVERVFRWGGGMDVATEFKSKILSRSKEPDEYRVYRAGLEWDLTDPIVVDGEDDFKSKPRWSDRLTPYHHQVTNLITFCRRLPVTLLADDVGLGKTISAGLVISELVVRSRLSRVLIVCPKILAQQWKEELEAKFDIPGTVAFGKDLLAAEPEEVGAVITTYNSARLYLERLPEDRFQMLVLDEAHKLRNLYGVPNRPGSNQRVEFAIKLPGGEGGPLWLPIDAKFPTEDYERLIDASERADAEAVDSAGKALETRIRQAANDIATKYIHAPFSTDFGVLFLPTEGLYAEVIRRPGLADYLQRENRILLTGPTTLLALLNSLRMGFRTLAIQKRSGEVWQILGAVKSEFNKYGTVLDKVQRKLQEASNTIDDVSVRKRAIDRKLRSVEMLPELEATALLAVPNSDEFDQPSSDELQSIETDA